MTSHMPHNHQCPKCGVFYIPYDANISCPKCGNLEEKRMDFIPEAAKLAISNLERGSYIPNDWHTGSTEDEVLWLVFQILELHRTDDKESSFESLARACVDNLESSRYDKEHLFKIFCRVNEEIQKLRSDIPNGDSSELPEEDSENENDFISDWWEYLTSYGGLEDQGETDFSGGQLGLEDDENTSSYAVWEDEQEIDALRQKKIKDESNKHCNEGVKFRQKGEYNLALSEFEKAKEIWPDNPRALYDIGTVYLFKNKPEGPIKDELEEVVKKELEDAISYFTKAIDLDPNIAIAYYKRGIAYYWIGFNKRALQDFDEAKSLGFKIPQELYDEVVNDIKRIS